MTQESSEWRKIWDIFHDALEQRDDERETFILTACAGDEELLSRVRKLLDAHDDVTDEEIVDAPALLSKTSDELSMATLQPGQQLGLYQIVRLIGEGGMGLVYHAYQKEPVKREVAIKVLQSGFATREIMARFEAERQALALMSHSNIAKVYDAGSTETGQPYFVMELVIGAPITSYCDEQQLGIIERLHLVQRVGDGILHAHQKGIIHRDIKPSNVLIALENGQPVPKIIDFGIAKATTQTLSEETLYTQMGAMIGTPGYMSPEQAGVVPLDVDTRADVFSLGVLIYELLFGILPFESLASKRGLFEVQEAIRDEEPQRPSARVSEVSAEEFAVLSHNRTTSPPALRRLIDGDMAWVALKAMEKDRTRRYSSVAELLADVGRYLDGLPVLARAPTRRYRAAKFVRRHKLGVAISVGGILLTLVFAGFMTLQTLRLQEALAETTLQRDRAEQVSDFMAQLFEGANPEVVGEHDTSAKGMLKRGAEKLKIDLDSQPALRANLLTTIGESFRVLGGDENTTEAIALFNQALLDFQSLTPTPTKDIAATHNLLGAVYHDSGDFDAAEEHYQSAIDLFRVPPADDFAGLADTLGNLSVLYTDRGDLNAAFVLAQESLELQVSAHGQRSPEVARTTQRLGYILHRQGKSEAALPLMLGALAMLKENHGDVHPFVANSLNYTATVINATGDSQRAQALFREAANIYRSTHGDDHPYLAATLSNLALAYNKTNDFQLAIDALDEAMRIGVASYGASHPNVNAFRVNIGTNLQDMGRYVEAEPFLRLGLEQDRKDLDTGSRYLIATIGRLGALLNSLGQLEEAQRLLQEALAMRLEHFGERHADTGAAYSQLAINLLAQGELVAAATASQKAVDVLAESEPGSSVLASSLVTHARVMIETGNLVIAQKLLDEASEIYGEPTIDTAASIVALQENKAELAIAMGNESQASEAYATAEMIFVSLLGSDHPDLARIQMALARLACDTARRTDSVEKIRDARGVLERSLGAGNWQLESIDAATSDCLSGDLERD